MIEKVCDNGTFAFFILSQYRVESSINFHTLQTQLQLIK